MKIRVSSPPQTGGGKYDEQRLNAWLNELVLAVNMGFANIGYENLNNELKAAIGERSDQADV